MQLVQPGIAGDGARQPQANILQELFSSEDRCLSLFDFLLWALEKVCLIAVKDVSLPKKIHKGEASEKNKYSTKRENERNNC